jgi:DNA gyrase subunit A
MEIEAPIHRESQDRYLTYALSVVSERALPDVRDGLKPVQRRILYAMFRNLGLRPDRPPRKSAAVVGEVLARYHPHGDTACYDAMVRMAQDFSLRCPLIEGQGNFGSMDGDAAAAYRYTEARLRRFALEVLGEIDEETVPFKDNFDATTKEPMVLPSRVPHLLVNGASGIAVGMATNIPPHNLKDVVRALLALSEDPDISVARLTTLIKGPDFPTGCLILNTKTELEEIYRSGRGSVKMRGEWVLEETSRGKQSAIITSIPYSVNKSVLIERIANHIIEKKVPQLVDVRDESTDDVRIVLELAPGADAEVALAFLFKNTPLETTFAVNMTALVPTQGKSMRPSLLSLRECLQHFLDFRQSVVEAKLLFEKKNLQERIHILEGLVIIFDALDEVLEIVRASKGRQDAADKLRKRFDITEIQSLAVVDMRVYQLSRTNISEVRAELKSKSSRVREIDSLLRNEDKLIEQVRAELKAVVSEFGERRKCRIDSSIEDVEIRQEDFLIDDDVFALVTREGWIKRIRQNNDVSSSRVREGDEMCWAHPVSTLDYVLFFTNFGTVYSLRVSDFPSSSGFGTPVQKLLKFKDGERIVSSCAYSEVQNTQNYLQEKTQLAFVTKSGLGSGFVFEGMVPTKRNGRKFCKVKDGDEVVDVFELADHVLILTEQGYALRIKSAEVPLRDGPSQGVLLMSPNEKKKDAICGALSASGRSFVVAIHLESGRTKEISWASVGLGKRGLRGQSVVKGARVVGAEFI